MYEPGTMKNTALFAWIFGYISSIVVSLEPEGAITVNKVRGNPKTWIHVSKDIVRCFCNLPQCITTGYMCKSNGGGCFSNFTDEQDLDYRGRHGCLELLSDDSPKCDFDPSTNTKPSILCCYHDMCNHVDSPPVKEILNDTAAGIVPDPPRLFENLPQAIDYSNSQVWFRAATIAVPVCGAVILFVLIALAVKILRKENQGSGADKLRKYPPCEAMLRQKCYHPVDDPHRIRVPLLVPEGCKETNAKVDLMRVNECKEVILEIEKVVPKCNLVNHMTQSAKYKC